ncbi:MAG: DUF1993 family protein [Pseudomonadota bacterium]
MTKDMSDAVAEAVKRYLARVEHILQKLSDEPNAPDLLAIRLAPDMFDTGFNVAIAIQFAARALCPTAGLDVPEIPDIYTCDTLLEFHQEVSDLIAPLTAHDLTARVVHTAGQAELSHDPAEYIARFALPNMIFHLTLAYAGLRHGGMSIGKADFDGMHVY